MKKILFITHIVRQESNGVWKKVSSQINALRNLNFQVDYIYRIDDKKYLYEKDGIDFVKILTHKFFIFLSLARILKKSYDIVYIRKPHGGLYSLFLSCLLKVVKKINPEVKIYMEIPTYPYANEVRSLIGYISHYAYAISFIFFKKYITQILCIGDAPQYINNVPAIKFRNGVNCDVIKPISRNVDSSSFVLVGIANLVYWHGYDRLIYSLEKFNGPQNVLFYIVGDNEPEFTRLKNIVTTLNLQDKVIFLGNKTQSQITEILRTANMCVDSLGRHRSGNDKNDSIKSKEYTAMGIPFIKSHIDDSFGNEPFIYQVSSNEDYFSIEEIINWYNELPDDIVTIEREYAVNNLSWEKIFKDLFTKEL